MKTLITLGIILLVLTHRPVAEVDSSEAGGPIEILEQDRTRIAEAFKIGEHIGDRIWSGWSDAPFAVLLITSEREFLIRHPEPSDDFEMINYDSLLQSNVYVRKRVFSTNLLATFPAVGGIPTIVIGQMENTSVKNSTAWVLTLLHEHFHQLQYSQNSYYADVDALDLSGGDQTGMWMLNYAFPYTQTEVIQKSNELGKSLLTALSAKSDSIFVIELGAYRSERHKLKSLLEPKDYKYFSFQLWQEGVARYTEYSTAAFLARNYKPTESFEALADYKTFIAVAEDRMSRDESCYGICLAYYGCDCHMGITLERC